EEANPKAKSQLGDDAARRGLLLCSLQAFARFSRHLQFPMAHQVLVVEPAVTKGKSDRVVYCVAQRYLARLERPIERARDGCVPRVEPKCGPFAARFIEVRCESLGRERGPQCGALTRAVREKVVVGHRRLPYNGCRKPRSASPALAGDAVRGRFF